MHNNKVTGLFGKLPAHGDFLCRDLPPKFVNIWDNWLQGFVGGSQEQLGESWLDIYLTSPIWRFALSDGIIDEHVWAGVMLPSVDRVGRYFPFSIVRRVDGPIRPTTLICSRQEWFSELESICLQGLEGQILIDDIIYEIEQLELDNSELYGRNTQGVGQFGGVGSIIKMDFEEQSPLSVAPYMLDSLLAATHTSYSVWSTQGSEYVDPCLFSTKGLPMIGGVSAMMDGRWEDWNWQEPFKLKGH